MKLQDLSIADLYAIVKYSGNLALTETKERNIKACLQMKHEAEEELCGRFAQLEEMEKYFNKQTI